MNGRRPLAFHLPTNRRARLIGSQLVIVAGLLAIALTDPGPADIAPLSAFALVINIATTFQNVAVDGMAVDLLADAERPRANALMFGEQALGTAGAGAITGFGLATVGLPAVAAALALLVALLVLPNRMCRERPGGAAAALEQRARQRRNRAHPASRLAPHPRRHLDRDDAPPQPAAGAAHDDRRP
jgi:PAT family beta-lactamase induction signal transducer AmpG